MNNLRQYIDLLRKERQIVEINALVSSDQELAEIHRRVVAAGGPALLFNNVEDADFPCATNLFGTPQRVERRSVNDPSDLYSWCKSPRNCPLCHPVSSGTIATSYLKRCESEWHARGP